MHIDSPTWSVYEGEADQINCDAYSAAQSPLLQRLTGSLPAATLRGCGVRKSEIIRRGAQGVIYAATHTVADNSNTLSDESSCHTVALPCAVKRLFLQPSDFGRRGVAESVLRESTLLRRVSAIQRDAMRCCSADCLVDNSCRVVELYRVVEAPHHELCLVLEQCALDLSHVIIDKMGYAHVENGLDGSEDAAHKPTQTASGDALHLHDVYTTMESSRSGSSKSGSRSRSEGNSMSNKVHRPSYAHKKKGTERCPLLAQLPLIRFLLRRMLRTVLFLHERCGVVHRDLKLSNFLVTDKGGLRLCDFGSARLLLSAAPASECNGSGASRCADETVCYTPGAIRTTLLYRAPEQLLGGYSAPTAADVWSLGVIFAELCLQRHLFHANSELAMIGSIWKLLGAPSSASSASCNVSNVSAGIDVAVSGTLAIKFSSSLLSEHGLQLLRGMLCMDPAQRITLGAALQHPFLCFPGDEEDDACGESLWRQRVAAAWRAKTEVVRVAMPKLGMAATRHLHTLHDEEESRDDAEEDSFAYGGMAAHFVEASDESGNDDKECRGLPGHGFGLAP